MAKIERYNGNVAAFASQADTNKRTTFGTTTTGDDTLDGNLTADYFTGWQIVGPNDSPTLEDFNAAMFTAGQFLSYLHQAGVPEWNGVQQYQIGSYVNRAGVLYVCKTADHVSVTAPESDGVNWNSLFDSLNLGTAANADVTTSTTDTTTGRVLRVDDGVNKGSAQTVTGVKTFTASPVVPDATTATQALARGQVDVANSALVKTALNATGTAPIYACRAWVNFNGTGTIAIRASGNVSSLVDNTIGDYTMNLTTPMPDLNYSIIGSADRDGSAQNLTAVEPAATSSSRVKTTSVAGSIAAADSNFVSVSIFR